MALRASILQHEEHEGLGRLESALEIAGFDCQVRLREVRTEDVDAPLVVVLGGPMGVYETARHPFLLDELRLVRHRVERRLPVLGVCLGAQVLAAAAGARVFPGTNGFELGAGPVELTAEGRADPVFGPVGESITVAHWHGDTYSGIPGAVRLAGTVRYPEQAFRLGPSYGLQFHVELDGATLSRWAESAPEDLARAEVSLARVREEALRLDEAASELDALCLRLAKHFARVGR